MQLHLFFPALLSVGVCQLSPVVSAQPKEEPVSESSLEGKEVNDLLAEREGRIGKLSTEEQLLLRAAQVKAASDPDVKAAVEKRDQAIQEFRLAFRNSMIKSDPKIQPILDKIAVGNNPGF